MAQAEPKLDHSQIERVVYDAIDSIAPELHSVANDLHSHPELGTQEFHAHQVLTDQLERFGFKVTRKAFGLETAFLAEYGDASTGRRVGFCSEYDALPGLGHGCGHNQIATTGLACAFGLKTLIEKGLANGKVVLFGTPSEELLSGKIEMLQKNAFQDNADVCMMLHPGSSDCQFISMAAQHDCRVEFHGKASHAGATPWDGANALDAICQAWVAIGLLRQQLLPSDRIHGIITNGGKAPNVIPDYTAGYFYVRATSTARVLELMSKVETIFNSAATMTGCSVTVTWNSTGVTKQIIQNGVLGEKYATYHNELRGPLPPRAMQEAFVAAASTDFGNVSHVMPGLHPIYNINTEASPHTIEFAAAASTDEAHANSMSASKALAMVGAHVLLDAEFYDACLKDYDATVSPEHRQ